jgi:esterase/lipase superfamily enzyme
MAQTTVFFITNRAPAPAGVPLAEAFTAQMVPLEARRLTCGVAFVDNTDPNPAALDQRHIIDLNNFNDDAFNAGVQGDIIGSGKPLLLFVHGFANSFDDAIKRAAFNREWFAASGVAAADCTVIAFTWPSAGKVIDGKDVLPGVANLGFTLLGFAFSHAINNPLAHQYQHDQDQARSSGRDLARSIDRLVPVLQAVRKQGRKVFLLVHSMGHVVLQGAFAAWQNSGQSPGFVFDEAVLAAGDADAAFAEGPPAWVRGMPKLARRTSIYQSTGDQILMVSQSVNDNRRRLGFSGPVGGENPALFPAGSFCFVDCSALRDSIPNDRIDATHQYYRRVPAARDAIATTFSGAALPRTQKL